METKPGLKQRLSWWKLRSPRAFWLTVAAIAAALVGLITLLVLSQLTFTNQLSYKPCEVKYGETVAGWDGDSDQLWNERGYRYEVKRFLVQAAAPRTLLPNVAEKPPTVLASSHTSGNGCSGFDGKIDPLSEDMAWYGAHGVAARLGVPDLGNTNKSGELNLNPPKLRTDDSLSPPLYPESARRAAAWVDDGAKAELQNSDKSQTTLLWCQGMAAGSSECKDTPASGQAGGPIRGHGYLFVKDNCPSAGHDCGQISSWYEGPNLTSDPDYTKLIGLSNKGELMPFYLHLTARSTYAPVVGAWMSMTFKYPKVPQLANEVTASPKTVKPGETIELKLSLGKVGPDLARLEGGADITGQPLAVESGLNIDQAVLDKVNNDETVVVSGKYKVQATASPGQCYDIPVNLNVESTAFNDGTKKVSVQPASGRFCIENPNVSKVYTYEVNSRGDIQSDLNEFARLAAETYASAQGWSAAGVSFQRVESGGSFTLVLASPDKMTTFSSGCDATYSCQAGRYVIINDERWRLTTPAWQGGGGSLRDYRHMVVNHETGHWLGFGHLNCPAPGQPAPVMQQQSISLQGCSFNPWPTPGEVATLKSRL